MNPKIFDIAVASTIEGIKHVSSLEHWERGFDSHSRTTNVYAYVSSVIALACVGSAQRWVAEFSWQVRRHPSQHVATLPWQSMRFQSLGAPRLKYSGWIIPSSVSADTTGGKARLISSVRGIYLVRTHKFQGRNKWRLAREQRGACRCENVLVPTTVLASSFVSTIYFTFAALFSRNQLSEYGRSKPPHVVCKDKRVGCAIRLSFL